MDAGGVVLWQSEEVTATRTEPTNGVQCEGWVGLPTTGNIWWSCTDDHGAPLDGEPVNDEVEHFVWELDSVTGEILTTHRYPTNWTLQSGWSGAGKQTPDACGSVYVQALGPLTASAGARISQVLDKYP